MNKTLLLIIGCFSAVVITGCNSRSEQAAVSSPAPKAVSKPATDSAPAPVAPAPVAPAPVAPTTGKETESSSSPGESNQNDSGNSSGSGSSESSGLSEEEQMQREMQDEQRQQQEEMEAQAKEMQEQQAEEQRQMQEEQEEMQRQQEEEQQQQQEEMEMQYEEGGQGGPPIEIPKTLKGKSDLAFQEGHDTEAFQYLYAYYLTTAEGAAEHQLSFFPKMSESRTVLRWGIAVEYIAKNGFQGRIPKIGDKPNWLPGENSEFEGADMREEMREEMRDGEGGAAKPMVGITALDFYTGDIGSGMLEEIDKRRTEKAAFGAATSKIEYKIPEPKSGGNDDYEQQQMEMEQQRQSEQNGWKPPKPLFTSEKDQLLPGVVYIGTGRERDLLEVAHSRNIDLFVMLDVLVEQNMRNGQIKNTTKVTFYELDEGAKKTIKTFTSISNVKFWERMEKEEDLIAELLTEMFEGIVDEKYIAQPMPDLKPEHVSGRVTSLLTDIKVVNGEQVMTRKTHENPLPVLAEVNYYHHSKNNLLPQDAYEAAVSRLIGESNAEMFIKGDEREKAEAIAEWLPEDWRRGLDLKASEAEIARAKGIELYTSQVQPILLRCHGCHSSSAKTVKAELKIDTFADLVKGGKSGPAVVPEKPDESLMMQAIKWEGKLQMPPRKKLEDAEIDLVRQWIELGAPMPLEGEESGAGEAKSEEPDSTEVRTDKPEAVENEEGELGAVDAKTVTTKVVESEADASKTVEPKAVEPKAEEPKAEEPKAEEPKAEEPKTIEPEPVESPVF